MGGNNFLILLIIVPIGIMLWYFSKKRKGAGNDKSGTLNNRATGSGDRKDEVWRTIKEYLRSNNQKGLEIISSYSIRRPSFKDLYNRLKEAQIYEAKELSKKNKVKYRKPSIPKKYPLEQYFSDLYQETYELSKHHRQDREASKAEIPIFNKQHREVFIKKQKNKTSLTDKLKKLNFVRLIKKGKVAKNDLPQDRELYVLIYRTRNPRDKKINEPVAIEVEILKKSINSKNTERKIIINKKLDLNKEMSWIKPIKAVDDKKAIEEEKRNKKVEEKLKNREIKRKNKQLWYHKITPKILSQKIDSKYEKK